MLNEFMLCKKNQFSLIDFSLFHFIDFPTNHLFYLIPSFKFDFLLLTSLKPCIADLRQYYLLIQAFKAMDFPLSTALGATPTFLYAVFLI